jgi:hypothetical protein
MSRLNVLAVFLFLLSFSLLASQVWAHTPLSPIGEIHSLDTAYEVPNPTKSWTLYRELHHEGEAEYYKLHLEAGERLRISLYTKDIQGNFSPHLVVMADDLAPTDDAPGYIEKPEGFGAILIEPSIPQNREYEPFTPASYYYLIDVDEPISEHGDYYVVVFEPNMEEGKYGIAIGYKEEFTISEWLLIPFDLIRIHEWEGQSLIEIIAPLLLTLVVGLFILVWKAFIKLNLFNIIASTAGLLYVGSGLMIFMQMIIAIAGAPFNFAVVLTVIFIAMPLVLGYFLVRKVILLKGELSTKDRVIFVVFGIAGLFTWSGLIIGPGLAIFSGLFPKKMLKKETIKQ